MMCGSGSKIKRNKNEQERLDEIEERLDTYADAIDTLLKSVSSLRNRFYEFKKAEVEKNETKWKRKKLLTYDQMYNQRRTDELKKEYEMGKK